MFYKNRICLLFIVLFLTFNFQLKSQIYYLDSSVISKFIEYDIIFLGERHNIASTDSLETLLVSFFKTKNAKVLVEEGYEKNYLFYKFFLENDTINLNFFNASNNKYSSKLFRLLYNFNIVPKAIDIISNNDIIKEFVLDTYSKKILSDDVKNDLNEFSSIGAMKFPHKSKNIKKYSTFIHHYYRNLNIHNTCLADDSVKINEYFESLKSYLLAEKDSSSKEYETSNFREDFMFEMFKKQIFLNPNSQIISINGCLHICLDVTNNFNEVKNKSWIPLAVRLKTFFPDKKICSVYLLNMRKDVNFFKAYPKEVDYICKSIARDKYYIINLDYENTPFKNLIGKYTHIVVY